MREFILTDRLYSSWYTLIDVLECSDEKDARRWVCSNQNQTYKSDCTLYRCLFLKYTKDSRDDSIEFMLQFTIFWTFLSFFAKSLNIPLKYYIKSKTLSCHKALQCIPFESNPMYQHSTSSYYFTLYAYSVHVFFGYFK